MSSLRSLIATTQASCKTVIHNSVSSFLAFSSERLIVDDSRSLFDGLRCQKIVDIAPYLSVDLGFKPRISAFKSRLKQPVVKYAEHSLEFYETMRYAREIFARHLGRRASSLGKQW